MDFTFSRLGIPFSFGVELRDLGEFGTRLPADQILPTAEEALEAVKVGPWGGEGGERGEGHTRTKKM